MKISHERLLLLNAGKVATKNLGEVLAVDFAALLSAAVPAMPENTIQTMREAASIGILKRMRLASELVYNAFGPGILSSLQEHPSDTVRGWACFILSMTPLSSLEERLESVQGVADDGHFGVREWAWLAVRPHIAENLNAAIAWVISPFLVALKSRA